MRRIGTVNWVNFAFVESYSSKSVGIGSVEYLFIETGKKILNNVT